MKLSELYLKAFTELTSYINEILSAFIPVDIQLNTTGWLDFLHFGFTDLKSWLSFVFSILLFFMIHYLLYRGLKWLIKWFGGVVYKW